MVHIGTDGQQHAEPDAQREERLPNGHQHHFHVELREVGHEQEGRSRAHVAGKEREHEQRQQDHEQGRRKVAERTLETFLYTGRNRGDRQK